MKREVTWKDMPHYVKGIEGRTVTGITAVTGNVDDGGDRIIAGAFAKTIAENSRRFRHLWQHGDDGWSYGTTPPIAAIKAIQEVGREALPLAVLQVAPEATGGLEVTREYLDTERGNEILACYQAGIPLEMSIGYSAIQTRRVAEAERATLEHWRDLVEIKLFDTSDVNWGMNSATVGSKSMEQRLTILVERLKALRAEEVSQVEEALQEELRAVCARWGRQELGGLVESEAAAAESRAEPTEHSKADRTGTTIESTTSPTGITAAGSGTSIPTPFDQS